MSIKDLYRILSVNRNATLGDIKASYRKLAMKLHPDVTNNNEKLSEEFKRINHAYEILSDESQRMNYDTSVGIRRSSHEYESIYRNKKTSTYSSSTDSRQSASSSAKSADWSHFNPKGFKVKTPKYEPFTGPVYGYNDAEWRKMHYGSRNELIEEYIRRTRGNKKVSRDDPAWQWLKEQERLKAERLKQEVEARQAQYENDKKEREKVRAEASEALRKKRQARHEKKNEDQFRCVIS